MPAPAQPDPGHGKGADKTPPGQAQQAPGQAKKQAPAEQPAAAPAAPAQPAPQAPAKDKHAAKQPAKAQRKAAPKVTRHAARPSKRTSAATQTLLAAPTTVTRQPTKATGATTQTKTNPPQSQSDTSHGRNPNSSSPNAPVAAAPAPAPAPASAPVTSGGSLTAAKPRHKATKRRAAASPAQRTAAPASSSAPVATISPAPVAGSGPKATTKASKQDATSFVPAPRAKADDQPNVVFRTVRDAVDVIPTAIWVLLGLLTFLAALFAVTSARQTRRAHRLAAERGTLLGDVGVLQEAVLPVVPPHVGALAMSVAHRPAGGPAAGGDLYDVVALDNDRAAVIVGDVSGHGPGALGHATIVRFTLRAHLESGSSPREALAIAADTLASHFDEGFATAAIALHDPDEGTLTYATAAHEAPIVIGPGEHTPIVVASTPPLGIGGPPARRQTTVPFPEGSLATMLTDGALEARLRGELVGRARVEEWVRELGARPAAGDMAEMIRERAAVNDDLAVCFATATRGADTGNWRVEELHRPSADEAARFLEACGASEEHKRAVAEALRFSATGMVLRVRFENGVVVAADVSRNGSSKAFAA